jgi:hypothetical protein
MKVDSFHSFGYWIFIRLTTTFISFIAIAGGFGSLQYSIEDTGSTTNARLNSNRPKPAIIGTSPTLHTIVHIGYPGFAVHHFKNSMRANFGAHPATGTQIGIES